MIITDRHQLAALRKRYRLTQRALADLLGTTETTVSRLECGKAVIDTRWASHLGLLAQHLKSTPEGWSHVTT